LTAALQAIVQLNITNQTTLDLLLAALFDNTTGSVSGGINGVNGTFQLVTFQVPSLGLESEVVKGIPNVAVPSDGLYRSPASEWPRAPPAGFWGNFWNAVTSVIENPLGALFSLATVVWNAATAIATYFDHIAREAAVIGGKVVGRVASALVSVGEALVSALNVLLAWILDALSALFSPIINAINATMTSYLNTIWSSFQTLWTDINDSTTITASMAFAFWNALLGSPFLIAVGIATAVSVAFVIIDALSLGTEFVVTDLLTIVAGAAVGAIVHGLSSWGAVALISPTMVGMGWSMFNLTNGGLHAMLSSNTSNAILGGVCAFAGICLGAFQLFGDSDAEVTVLSQASQTLLGPVAGPLVATFAVVTLAIDIVALMAGSFVLLYEANGLKAQALDMFGLVLGGLGLLMSICAAYVYPLSKWISSIGLGVDAETGLALSEIGVTLSLAGYAEGR
jgi:hypothetical protein